MFEKNPLTKSAFVVTVLVYIAAVFTMPVAVIEVAAWVFVFLFIALVLRAETLGEVAKTMAEGLKSKWSK
jgi:hypothetical protein